MIHMCVPGLKNIEKPEANVLRRRIRLLSICVQGIRLWQSNSRQLEINR